MTYEGRAGKLVLSRGKAILVLASPHSWSSRWDHQNTIRGGNNKSNSEDGPEVTIIDAENIGSVVTFASGQDSTAIFKGFTVQNGAEGGINAGSASPIIIGNVVRDNYAVGLNVGTGSRLIENIIEDNSYRGVSCESAYLERNVIRNNAGGGVKSNSPSSPSVLINNFIFNNIFSSIGGGIEARDSTYIINNTIAFNHSYGEGGGIWCQGEGIEIINNIITNNSSGQWGGGISAEEADPFISYNDVWNNSSANYAWCAPGNGDISANPRYIDPSSWDYHLQNISPCIEAGTETDALIDIDGEPRPYNDNWDMGADEYWPPGPDISVYPYSFFFELFRDQSYDTSLTIYNRGADTLDISIDWQASWLSISPTVGAIPAGDSLLIDVVFDATDLSIFTYMDTVYINSNDILDPVVKIPAVLEVLPNVTVELTPFQTIVPIGGTLDFKQTFTNLTNEDQTFYQRFDGENSGGQHVYNSKIERFTIEANDTVNYIYSITVPHYAPPDTYTFYTTIGIPGPVIWDIEQFDIEVIPLQGFIGGGRCWDVQRKKR